MFINGIFILNTIHQLLIRTHNPKGNKPRTCIKKVKKFLKNLVECQYYLTYLENWLKVEEE
jgi:hypothetical protein